MKGLTKRQCEILDFIDLHIEKEGYSPSYREIAMHFSISSVGAIHKHIQTLKKKGVLNSESKSARSIVLTKTSESQSVCDIPFMGYLSKTKGIETFSKFQTIQIPKDFLASPENSYAIRVKGDGFSNERITNGDLLLVEGRSFAEPGETVLATLPGVKILIKKYHPLEETIELQSTTEQKDSLFVDPAQLMIIGIICTQIRSF